MTQLSFIGNKMLTGVSLRVSSSRSDRMKRYKDARHREVRVFRCECTAVVAMWVSTCHFLSSTIYTSVLGVLSP